MPRLARLLLASFLTLLLIVAGCDTVGTEHPPDESLLQIEDASPGAVVYNLSTTGAVKEYFPGSVDDERGGLELPQSRAASQPASDYACYLSVYHADGERGPGYYYRSFYLHFPKPLVEEAEGKMGTLRYAWHDEAVDHPSKVAMLARCRLPQTRGAAELLARRLGLTLEEPPAESAARTAPPAEALRAGEGSTTEAATADDELPVYYPVLDGDIPNGAGYTCTEGTDWMSYDQDYCTDGAGIYLPEAPIEDDPPPPGGGGSGGSGGGYDDPTWPGGGDDGPLHDPAPVEDDGGLAPPEIVSKSEVADLIRKVCDNVSGITLPSHDDNLQDYFQASVRKSINAVADYRDRYKWDASQNHPQLTWPVDGYAESVTYPDGTPIPGIVTSILEVKYAPNPSNSMGRNQWQAHIDDLARAYELSPDEDFLVGAPRYVIATLSKFDDIEYFGSYSTSVEMPAYAAQHGVNVMHLRVIRDHLGQYRLDGDLIGSPVNFRDWLWDVLTDASVPFVVACTPED